jgi:hypothetical protein
LKNDLESLFRDAGRISPDPDLWRRIAERSPLASGGERGQAGLKNGDGAKRGEDLAEADDGRAEHGTGRSERGEGRLEGAARPTEWLELRYLRAAGVVLAAGLLALAAIGVLRRPHGELVREASAERYDAAEQGASQVFDPELLGWQADLGDYELVADQAEEAL